MALRTVYRQVSQGIRIPYPAAAQEHGRGNFGFVDVRGRPEAAAQIVEARSSAALQALLMRLAEADSPWFSLGCDLGAHEESEAPVGQRHVAGGYLHVAGAGEPPCGAADCLALAGAVEAGLTAKVANRSWRVAFLLTPVELALDDRPVSAASLNITFYAAAESSDAARRSREALLKTMLGVIAAKGDTHAAHG